MPGVENYQRHPGKKLECVLAACGWKQVGDGLWEKGRSRLFIDIVGVFLYRWRPLFRPPCWLRVAGLSHNLIRHLPDRLIKFDDFTLNLLTGN